MAATRSKPRALFRQLFDTADAKEIYERQFVDSGLVGTEEKLAAGTPGFNISKMMKYQGQRRMGQQRRTYEGEQDVKRPGAHTGYDVVHLNNWVEGWGHAVEEQYGHRNAFAAAAMLNDDGEGNELQSYAQDSMDDAKSIIEKVATRVTQSKAVDSGVVQDATPILVDPDFQNTVRTAAPILDWVDVVAQAGFTASYNVVSARDSPTPGWTTEADVLDLSDVDGSAFTMPNEEKDMKIWADVVNVSDFAARAQSSLDFMDLEGTTMQIKAQEYAVREAEMVLYGNPDSDLSDGLAHDAQAPEGLHKIAEDAGNTQDVSTFTIEGDKPLFSRIKQEILELYKNTAAALPNLGAVVSVDMFHELEDEANINVRLDSFDQGINFGRDPTIPTLSIANVPILPDPNIREHDYGGTEYDGHHGDVFIFERPNFQRRALAPFSSMSLGRLGLAERAALFQYETPIERSQGQHVRVLEGFDIPELGA